MFGSRMMLERSEIEGRSKKKAFHRLLCGEYCRKRFISISIPSRTPWSHVATLPFAGLRRYNICTPVNASCPKPVISAVHSACVGAGVDLVCATDIRLASSDAWFSVKEVSRATGPTPLCVLQSYWRRTHWCSAPLSEMQCSTPARFVCRVTLGSI